MWYFVLLLYMMMIFYECIHTQGTLPIQWESKVDIDTAEGVVVFTHGGNAGKCDKQLRKQSSLV